MAKEILNTQTIINKAGSNIGIYTFYTPRSEDILAFIADSVITKNEVNFIEGELGITKYGYDDVQFFLNESGDLVVSSLDPDRFDINSDGQLTITE